MDILGMILLGLIFTYILAIVIDCKILEFTIFGVMFAILAGLEINIITNIIGLLGVVWALCLLALTIDSGKG